MEKASVALVEQFHNAVSKLLAERSVFVGSCRVHEFSQHYHRDGVSAHLDLALRLLRKVDRVCNAGAVGVLLERVRNHVPYRLLNLVQREFILREPVGADKAPDRRRMPQDIVPGNLLVEYRVVSVFKLSVQPHHIFKVLRRRSDDLKRGLVIEFLYNAPAAAVPAFVERIYPAAVGEEAAAVEKPHLLLEGGERPQTACRKALVDPCQLYFMLLVCNDPRAVDLTLDERRLHALVE